MAITKTAVPVFASASISAGGTKTSPVAEGIGTAVDCRSYYGGEVGWKITNGSSAPASGLILTFQTSQDGINWYDYWSVSGDTTASNVTSGSLLLDRGVMYLRVLAYSNATNAVTAEAYLQAVSGL